MTTALEGGEGSASRPGRSLPPGKTRYQLYRRLGGPQDRSGQVRNISPPPGFDPRTVQPVASRYTDYATRPTGPCITVTIFLSNIPNAFASSLAISRVSDPYVSLRLIKIYIVFTISAALLLAIFIALLMTPHKPLATSYER
jgi:hypothetical protein